MVHFFMFNVMPLLLHQSTKISKSFCSTKKSLSHLIQQYRRKILTVWSVLFYRIGTSWFINNKNVRVKSNTNGPIEELQIKHF